MLLTGHKNFLLIALLILTVFNAKTVCAEIRIPVYTHSDIRAHKGNLKFERFESDNTALKFAYVNDPAYIYETAYDPIFFVRSNNICLRACSALLGYFSEPQILLLGMLILKKRSHRTEDMQPENNIVTCSYYFRDLLSRKLMVLSQKCDLENIETEKRKEGMCQLFLSLRKLKVTMDIHPFVDDDSSIYTMTRL